MQTTLSIPPSLNEERNTLVESINRGEFLKPCPGTTRDYLCCGYQILTPLRGCGMYCSYCVLQVYFDDQRQVLFKNWDDLEREVERKIGRCKGVVRVGTGEFADSLYLEPDLGLSRKTASLLEKYPNVLVEFKTKSANVDQLEEIRDPRKVVIGFSVNPPEIIRRFESGTASLSDRLSAAGRCEEMGFWVSFHFDPMIWYPEWESGYRRLVDDIFSSVRDPGRIAWWSMGGFRAVPELKSYLKRHDAHVPLFSGEIVAGEDRKLRYFRPVRVSFYKAVSDQIEKNYKDITLYLCMESPEVWEDCGMMNRIPKGLKAYLDKRARVMLGID